MEAGGFFDLAVSPDRRFTISFFSFSCVFLLFCFVFLFGGGCLLLLMKGLRNVVGWEKVTCFS
jgi:hypothetical protein